MAYWQKKHGKYVTVYYPHPETGKQTSLPRRLCKHLDNRTDDEINLWVEEWARLNEAHIARPDTIGMTPEMAKAYDAFMHYVEHELGRAPNTLNNYRRWMGWAAQYFASEPLARWPKTSKGFGQWLITERGVSESEALGANRAIKRFWAWAEDEDLVEGVLKVRGGKKEYEPTPLAHVVTPDEALAIVWRAPSPLNLIALLGYFFSLRPQETFALTRQSFLGGKKAESVEACAVMRQHGLYGRLAVYIGQQKTEKGQLTIAKKHSVGWVACFDERAAKLAVQLLANFEGFDKRPNRYYNMWREAKVADVSLKDMRRASLYWLGHYSSLPPVALKNHARHRQFSTTEHYLRRPGEGPDMGSLNLDD